MLPLNKRLLSVLFGVCGIGASWTALAEDRPVASWFTDQQSASQFTRSFYKVQLPATPAGPQELSVFLTVGDIAVAFDRARFRPDGAIVPTNMNLDLYASFPATQAILIQRVSADPPTLHNLQTQVDAERKRHGSDLAAGSGVLSLATGTFTASLKRVPLTNNARSQPFPTTVCLIATDYPTGGSISRRDLFTQGQVRIGVKDCLLSLDKSGAHSVMMPLIGAASIATQGEALSDPKERLLLRCRLVNAISGIALGISDFAPTRHAVEEIGIVQWDKDLLRLFSAPNRPVTPKIEEALAHDYQDYSQGVIETLRRGLGGKLTTGDDLKERDCNSILGIPDK
jgi:hypothetical protein